MKGKLLNVRNCTVKQLNENEEIKSIIALVGLEVSPDPKKKKVYKDTNGLRYGSIMVLADQDTDGFHIHGLVINFLHYMWPSLTKIDGFVKSLETPLLKAIKGKNTLNFYNIPEFVKWCSENDDGKGWKIKYYKGLGTHTPPEAKECFQNIDDKIDNYCWRSELSKREKRKLEQENNNYIYEPQMDDICEDAINLAFDKKNADARKDWINTCNEENHKISKDNRIYYDDFIHKKLILFSIEDVARSIPNIMDGLKPGQRKVLYGCFKKKLWEDNKVAQLAGYVGEHSAYHHGEASLHGTIINMAQDFVGANNISVLYPSGQFGSRLQGGKDAASPRYIFTRLNKIVEKIYRSEDVPILDAQFEEGMQIEPKFFVPIIPMILVNGTKGIGTGYSTELIPCDPRDIVNNVKNYLAEEKLYVMKPWFRHYTGSIKKIKGEAKYVAIANYKIDKDSVIITDLPIGIWTDNYKAYLSELCNGKVTKTKMTTTTTRKSSKTPQKAKINAKVAKSNTIGNDIKNYVEKCTEVKIDIIIRFKPGTLKKYRDNGNL